MSNIVLLADMIELILHRAKSEHRYFIRYTVGLCCLVFILAIKETPTVPFIEPSVTVIINVLLLEMQGMGFV